ncbi:hypothetical protein RKE30_17775 [Streptomyces sp. Li-HN-5-11]|uniref:hypothetical protein n=1 Tax=Streptomyces sp. Li-HN-5-11 TaxID=3075432 RepID=UPI0028B07E90|nr:hypothetical protein [Streptomyces sp. Li-HN-5-11]WNM32129.1 hypothetical protein RKE30_17775 [Streptomyces sp. Li-HN-5-11]WOP39105.1 hypothetical protein RKE32_37790 [Streptomyces sp. Li-HN-5-13]
MATPADALDPVRAQLLRAARAEADAVLERARADADETLRTARATAEQVLAQARDLGAADGHAAAARERVRAVEEAWSRELTARAEVYAQLRAGIRSGVRRALAGGAVPSGRFEEAAEALLGADARVTPAPDGGVTADVPGRHLDLSADTLADRALARLGARVESLWGPP